MLDYAALSALAAVVREGSFERAARALHLTPSAVSQRVRQLEERTGRILVQRTQPCAATAEGLQLLRHVEAVGLMERQLLDALPWLREQQMAGAPRPTLRIAVNADSLASWFVPALAQVQARHEVLFELVIEDQDHTRELMHRGEVLAAVTADAEPLQGVDSAPLGGLRYLATASPGFMARHFPAGVTPEALAAAPALRFNTKDGLQSAWIARHLGIALAPPCHWIVSSHGFVDAALAGLGWGMNPASLVQAALADGRLVELLPGHDLVVPLHWHCVRRPPELLRALGEAVRAAARARLLPA